MGLFGKKDKETISFYTINEKTTDGEIINYEKFPLFEDNKEAQMFCTELKHHGIDANPFGMKFTSENIEELRKKQVMFIGKNDDDLDFICWSCKELINHEKVKWKKRTFSVESLAFGDNAEEKLKAVQDLNKAMGKKLDEATTASPNRIFNGSEYEYRGSCPKCNSELTCFWFGIKSCKLNSNEVLTNKLLECPDCANVMMREFQVWYSIRASFNEEEMKEYLITVCPICKAEVIFPFEYDLDKGIIE